MIMQNINESTKERDDGRAEHAMQHSLLAARSLACVNADEIVTSTVNASLSDNS